MGGHSENPQALFLSLNLSTAGPGWPCARARNAGCTPPAQEIKASASRERGPLSPGLDACSHTSGCSCGKPNSPFTPATSVTLLLDWHISDEGVRGNYVSRAFQTHSFPKHIDIWEKNNLLLNGSFGFCKCVFSTVSCSTS